MDDRTERKEPLAYRMVPRTLAEYVGQEHILGPGRMLRRMVEADRLSSIILFGPPGTGKTALAKVIARTTKAGFQKLNAVTAGVADIKRVIADAQNLLMNPSGRTVLFIDEIHRFNKAQQDALLPHVEDGTLILVGATTENPFFEVNKALISRSTVFQLYPLKADEIARILEAARTDRERGLGDYPLDLAPEALAFLCDRCNGDARIALNGLELAAVTTPVGADGRIRIDVPVLEDCMQKRSLAFDHDGESHYDTISAFIKSMRGSDPDAAVFYLARALSGGEDIEFLARRITICAAEDVGMANPSALQVAMAAYQAILAVGMPEARIILAEAAVMVATSPKSNASYLAVEKALGDVAQRRTGEIPMHLRNAPVKGMEELGYHKGYQYAHDFPGHIVDLEYLPSEIAGTVYYEPTENGYEARVREWLDRLRAAKAESRAKRDAADGGAAAPKRNAKGKGKAE